MRSTVLVLMCFIGVAIAGGTVRAAESTGSPKQVPVVKGQPAIQMPLSLEYETTGSVEPARIAQLASPAEGPVIACSVREGDMIKAGTVVVRLGRTKAAEALMQSALADLRKEEAEMRRVEQLVAGGAIAAEQRGIARANLEKAKAQVEKLRESMEDFQIKAPWDGVVSDVLVRDGNFVGPRAPLVTMYDPASLIVRFAVPESQVALVRQGMPVHIQFDVYGKQIFIGKVNRVYPELDRKTRTLTLEAVLQTDLLLKPGMFARMQLQMAHNQNALVVPAEAIGNGPQGMFFVHVVRNGTVERRDISPGIISRDFVEVLAGLSPGEVVITESGRLQPGMQVKVLLPESKRQ